MTTKRATYLHVTEMRTLRDWAFQVNQAFDDVCFLVGSVLDRPDYRDVDLRMILEDSGYDRLSALVDVERLGFVFSLWGQQTTGLPVDFQVQRMTDANAEFDGRRHAIGQVIPDDR